MAETTTVSVTVNATGQVVSENVTFTDTKNNSLTIVGLPGATYNLGNIGSAVSTVTVTNTSTSVTYNNTLNEYQTLESIIFTDSNGNTITLLGAPNTVYDLTLLPYLSAVVNALDMFARMQFGNDYENVKNEYLQRAGLV